MSDSIKGFAHFLYHTLTISQPHSIMMSPNAISRRIVFKADLNAVPGLPRQIRQRSAERFRRFSRQQLEEHMESNRGNIYFLLLST